MISERGIEQGTIIYGSYIVEGVLGEGGFGITYLAVRQDTGEKVAVKEYFPFQLAVRKKESCEITVADKDREEYDRGRARFIKEASILKEFRYLQGIVKVWDCFEANNTAYIIMDYIDGVTLKEYISCHGAMSYQELMKMLSPILKSLITLHRHGVIHRDISPDNLMIGMDNSLYLIDFGAAKEMEYGKTTTVLLKAGYAPPEQYLHDGGLGAWTDVYALCATIYTALCGQIPADAVARLQGKSLIPLSGQGTMLEEWQWNAIAKGMSMRAAERFRDMGELYDALTVVPTEEDIQTVAGLEIEPQLQDKLQRLNETEKASSVVKRYPVRFAVMVVLLACITCAGLYFGGSRWTKQRGDQSTPNAYLKDAEDEAKEDTADATGEDTSDTAGQEKSETASFKTPRLCRMPNVAGLDKDAAIAKITAVDEVIRVRIIRQYSDSVERNVVLEQNVAPDTQYNEGAIKEIVLTVSDGAEPVTEADTKASAAKPEGKRDSYDVESDGNEPVDFYLGD